MSQALRQMVFRLLMIALLIASPIVFPLLLKMEGDRVSVHDLAEMYRTVYHLLIRGYL